MIEPILFTKKRLIKETERYVGQVHLQKYSVFLETYNKKLNTFKKKLDNNLNVKIKPISIEFKPEEDITLLHLIRSENKLLSRIFMSLGSICNEISVIVTEASSFYNILIFYEQESRKCIKNLSKISKLLEDLQKISFLVEHSQEVVILLLKQLCALLGREFYTGNSTSSFPEALDCIGELLVCLVTLDSLLNRKAIKDHLRLYQKAVRQMLHNSTKSTPYIDNLRCLFKQLSELESELLTGSILQALIKKCVQECIPVGIKTCSLSNEFSLYIQQLIMELERDDEHVLFTHIWLQANALLVFQHNLFGNIEKRLLKRLLEINKKVAACTLYGNILWYPEQFLSKHIPILVKNDLKSLSQSKTNQITTRSQNLNKESQMLCWQACRWMIKIESVTKKNMSQFKVRHLNDACTLFVDGMKLIKKICELVKWVTNLHANERRPMVKSVSLALCKLVEVLKAFQFIFNRHMLQLTYIILLISQHLHHKILGILANLKKGLIQEKVYKDQHLDILSALVVAERAMNGPNTSQRILLTKLCLSATGLSNDALMEIRFVISRLEVITNVGYLFNKLCNCSFLYWHQVLLPVYLSKQVESRVDVSRCYLLLDALTDCSNMNSNFTTKELFKTDLANPLSQIVETNLRLQTHLHLQLPPTDPFQCAPLRTFKKSFPALLDKKYIHIKREVEHYFSTIFYNLVTVVLHDWKTYGEMRRLAFLQYGLNTVESNLPMQTLEQGLDVLEIMRNINVFVGKYLYNLNNQLFIEEGSNNKHLNTITITHIANSIRTHGIGIMNTTVNFTYQFLRNKFFTFSQFMFDELIKSKLLKDIRYFSENRVTLNQMYPFERAEKFNITIRKLGLNQNNLSYLDLFRKLITQIGNAMGYIRLIRSGGRRCLADAICFIPDLKGISDFYKALQDAELPECARKSANCLERDIKTLVDNFEEATEYFKLLVNVFAPVFRNSRNMHMKNFYMIIPPLTINYVEHSLTCKERLYKKNRDGAAFTDDGFAMGLAYIIELLEQRSNFNSLRWFDSVNAKIRQDRKKVENERIKSSRDDGKLQQTLALTEKRINTFNNEFKLLYYNISSARIFFQ